MIRSTIMAGLGWTSDTAVDPSRPDVSDVREEHPDVRQVKKNLGRMAVRMAAGIALGYIAGARETAKHRFQERHLGYTAHRKYPVLTREPLMATVREANAQGKKIRVYLGCGPSGAEVIAAARDPKNRERLLVGVEHHGFYFMPSKEELSGAVFHDGRWQFLFRDLIEHGGLDEVVAVAPSAPWQFLERRMKNGHDAVAFLFAENVNVLSDVDNDFELLFETLKPGGRVVLYTEDAAWSADFTESLVRVFGLGVEVSQVPSSEAPPSRNLQRYPVTYVVTAVKRK